MDHIGSGPGRADRRLRPGRVVGTAVGLLLVEKALVGEVGSPMMLGRVLRGVGDPWADPAVSLLALMTLIAEVLAGYILLVLALRSLGTLPGLAGRLARRVVLAVTPAVIRRLADLLVGGTLLVQVTLAAPETPSGDGSSGPHRTVAASWAVGRPSGPATADDPAVSLRAARPRRPVGTRGPVAARPTPRRSAVPLPPWLGGGPSKPAPGHSARASGYTVEAGDTLWAIASAHLVPAERSTATIHRYWQQVYRANRRVVGADPDLIHPGTRLDVAPFRRGRR